MKTPISPENCHSMVELREQIDRLDEELVALLTMRSGYIDRAITLKKNENLPARISERVAEVLEKVKVSAIERGLDPELTQTVWTELIEWSIRRESLELD